LVRFGFLDKNRFKPVWLGFFRFFLFRFGFFSFMLIKPNRTGRFFQNFNRFNRFFFTVRFFRLFFFRFSRFNRFFGVFAHPYFFFQDKMVTNQVCSFPPFYLCCLGIKFIDFSNINLYSMSNTILKKITSFLMSF
jgi:hypothetical protein